MTFDIPKIDLPRFDLPKIDLPTGERVLGVLRNTAYAGTGLVALTAERLADLQGRLFDVLREQRARVRS